MQANVESIGLPKFLKKVNVFKMLDLEPRQDFAEVGGFAEVVFSVGISR